MKNFPEKFTNLLNEFSTGDGNDYIGQGNPNSSILIIGREHGFPKESDTYRLEVLDNHAQWLRITKGETFSELGYDPMTCFEQRGRSLDMGIHLQLGMCTRR